MGKRKRNVSLRESFENTNQQNSPEEDFDGKTSCREDLLSDLNIGSDECNNVCDDVVPNALSIPGSDSTALASSLIQRPAPQLRSSVRVQNKQKREEEKTEAGINVSNKKSYGSETYENERSIDSPHPQTKKRRRAWELWSLEDKDIFFEAINECGKDFEAIQNFLTTKLIKKGTPKYLVKNKDQVRFFYYRTYQKISKHIGIFDGIKKGTQELYSLVNYGELRKKTGGTLDERKGQKLQELIVKGSTSVRVKGKSIRIKTPICRALKKINEFNYQDQPEIRMPTNIKVELTAASQKSWYSVQALSHNPRVRFVSPPYRPVSSLLNYLRHKWKHPRLKLRESLVKLASFSVENPTNSETLLRIRPLPGCDIKRIHFQPDSHVKSSSVSLLSHEELLRKKDLNPSRKTRKRGQNKSEAKNSLDEAYLNPTDGDGEGSQEDTEGSDGESDPKGTLIRRDCDEDLFHSTDNNNKVIMNPFKVKEEIMEYQLTEETNKGYNLPEGVQVKEEDDPDSTIRQMRALETAATTSLDPCNDDVIWVGETTKLSAGMAQTCRDNQSLDVADGEDEMIPLENPTGHSSDDQETFIKEIRRGWTLDDVGCITIGQLYLMFGQNNCLSLEYELENSICEQTNELSEVKKSLLELVNENPNHSKASEALEMKEATNLVKYNEAKETNPIPKSLDNFSGMLTHLLLMSKSMFSKSNQLESCPCGLSNASRGSSNVMRSPAANKNLSATISRSPNTARSPRNNCIRSPKPCASIAAAKTSTSHKSIFERMKPLSAKKLIPDSTDQVINNTLKSEGIKFKIPEEAEFRVPIAPAPRALPVQQANFNAQISKLLPRLAVRPGRGMRKNMVVQRQLPLLPRSSLPADNLVTLNVLPNHPTPILPKGMTTISGTTSLVPITVAIAALPAAASMIGITNQINLVSSVIPTTNSVISGATKIPINPSIYDSMSSNAISVNVSGQQLLKVEIPAIVKTSVGSESTTLSQTITSCIPSSLISSRPCSSIMTVQTLPINNSVNAKISPMLNVTSTTNEKSLDCIEMEKIENLIHDMPQSPGNIGGPCHLLKGLINEQQISIESTLSTSSKLNDGSAPLAVSNLLNSAHLNIVGETNLRNHLKTESQISFQALLNLSAANSTINETSGPLSDAKQNSSRLQFINTPSTDFSISAEMASDNASTGMAPSIPQLHIPEGTGVNMPLLDISLGGTVTLQDSQENVTEPLQSFEPTSVVHLPNISSSDSILSTNKSIQYLTSTILEPSSDNIFDITLANSNSNSCFSSLLAAVSQSHDASLDNSLLQTPPRPQFSSTSTLKLSTPIFNIETFSSVTATAPSSPPSSPSQLVNHNENNWLNNEVNDFSFSSLLGSLESPVKQSFSHKLSENHNMGPPYVSSSSSSVPTSVSVLNENSVDFIAKFAEMKEAQKSGQLFHI